MHKDVHLPTEGSFLNTLFSKVGRSLAGLAIILAGFVGFSHTAQAQSFTPIQSTATGLCLDDTNYSTTSGTSMQMYTCLGGTNQTWYIQTYWFDGNNNQVAHIVNVLSNKCLSIAAQSNAQGVAVVQADCSAAPEQYWVISAPYQNILVSGSLFSVPKVDQTIKNNFSGLCISYTGTVGAAVYQATCQPTYGNFNWKLAPR